jgi:hypothetical protein
MAIVSEPEAAARIGINRIGGEWIAGSSGKFLKIDSPSTGEHLGYLSLSTRADVGRAVKAAEGAREAMRKMGTFARAQLCIRAGAPRNSRACSAWNRVNPSTARQRPKHRRQLSVSAMRQSR